MSDHSSVHSWLASIQKPPKTTSTDDTPSRLSLKRTRAETSIPRTRKRKKILAESSGNAMPSTRATKSPTRKDSTEKEMVENTSSRNRPSASKSTTLLENNPSYLTQVPEVEAEHELRGKTPRDTGTPRAKRSIQEQEAYADVQEHEAGTRSPTRRPAHRSKQSPRDPGQERSKLAIESSEGKEDTAKPGSTALDLTKTPRLSRRRAQEDETSTSSSRAKSSSRAASPIKTMADLRMANTPPRNRDLNGTVAKTVGGVLARYKRLVEVARGRGVVPDHLRSFLESSLHEDDWPPEEAYSAMSDDRAGKEYERSWGPTIQTVCRKAAGCQRDGLTEANWNARVHDALLELVIDNPRYKGSVGYMNITDTRIQPKRLSPVHLSGTQMQSKMVDFAIYNNPEPAMNQNILRLISRQPKDAQSVNQTMHGPLREKPIAVNFETKPPFTGGETADVQLTIWAGAGLRKLTELLQQDHVDAEVPPMPLVTFHGHDMHLSVIKKEDDHHGLYGTLHVGSTATVLGAFQMVAGLHVLTDWACTEYKDWFESVL